MLPEMFRSVVDGCHYQAVTFQLAGHFSNAVILLGETG